MSLLTGLFNAGRWRATAAIALSVGVAFTEGLAAILLIPLLTLAGVPVHDSASSVSAPVARVFSAANVHPTLTAVLAAYIVITISQAALTYARSLCDALVVQEYILSLRTRLYSAIARAEWLMLSRIRSSDFTFALTTAVDQVDATAHNVLYLIATAVVASVYALLAIRISPELSAIVLGIAGLLLLLERTRAFAGRTGGSRLVATTQELFATAAEQLGGLKTAKSYGNEERHLSLFLGVSRRVNEKSLALTRTFASLRVRMAIGSVLGLSSILYLAVETFHLPTAAILLLLFLFSRLVPRVVNLQQTFQEILSGMPALERIEALVRECEDVPEKGVTNQIPIELKKSIELRNVSFSYDPARTTQHLSAVSMSVNAGKTSAIIGSSGAGKSTLADILLGLIRPTQGTVLVDGVPLDARHLQSWRSQIGYVAQDTFLFNETVRFNLAWARSSATESEMLDALEHAAALEFVLALPHGLDTVIGERGVRLSGGERQRLSLARALLRKPRLLVLDEATSSLDSENEDRIYNAIDRLHGEITIVIITHRLATIRRADVIQVMEAGRCVASGTWEALMQDSNFRFRELARGQGLFPQDQVVIT